MATAKATAEKDKEQRAAQQGEDKEQRSAQQGDSGDESAYRDVSAQVEEAQEEAQKPVEYDDEGNVKPSESTAAAEVYDEMAKRSAGSGEGGGPWPPDLMLKRSVGATPVERSIGEYTSHEEQD
jgi:hypothetical protein